MMSRQTNRYFHITVLAALTCGLAMSTSQAAEYRIDPRFPGLIDGQGQPVDTVMASTRFRLVAFGFSHCREICPPTLQGMKLTLQTLGPAAHGLLPIFITVDPQRDAPRELADFVSRFDKRILPLAGVPAAINNITAVYRINYGAEPSAASDEAYTLNHTSRLTLTAPDGRVVGLVSAQQTPMDIAASVVKLLNADPQWRSNLGSLSNLEKNDRLRPR